MTISPSQARHIEGCWKPIALHREKPDIAVCNIEKCVTADDLKHAGITTTDLLDEEGGLYAGMETIHSSERVYCFDVSATQKRGRMSWPEYEQMKRSISEKMEIGG